MRVAYFTPLNPLKSGIADYVEELLPHLAQHMEIDLYVAGYTPSNKQITSQFEIFDVDQYEDMAQSRPYDGIVYNIGSNAACNEKVYLHSLRHPGIVAMYEYSIHHMIAEMTFCRGKKEEYLAEMAYGHGEEGRAMAQAFLDGKIPAPWETHSLVYPLNKRIIESAKGLIVFTYFARNGIKRQRLDIPVKKITHHTPGVDADPIQSYKDARQQLSIADEEVIIGTFGFIIPDKRIDKILRAMARLCKEGYQFRYYIIGGELGPDLERLKNELGIPKGVVVSTGFLGLDEGFNLYLRATDIGCNLRYPTQGETSSVLHRLLGAGKPALVSNAGGFREYPDSIVMKIDPSEREEDDIYASLKTLLDDKAKRDQMGRAAHVFAKENLTIERAVRQYCEFFSNVFNHQLKHEVLIEYIARGLAASGIDENHSVVKEISACIAKLP